MTVSQIICLSFIVVAIITMLIVSYKLQDKYEPQDHSITFKGVLKVLLFGGVENE